MVFLSPDKVLVYQVNRLREQRKLAPRSKTGGAGNFALQIRVIDARDGRDLKQLDLTTDAEQSSVVPVNDGRFVIRTGDQMFLYSPDFQRLAQKDLPLKRAASTETWTIAVSPSGAEMALVHDQIFYEPQLLMDGTVMNEGKAQTDVEILDPATLQTRSSSRCRIRWLSGLCLTANLSAVIRHIRTAMAKSVRWILPVTGSRS